LELADLIDLEWRLQADARAEDPTAVRARDRAWGPAIVEELAADADTLRHTLARDRAARAQVCAAWLRRLRRQPDHGLPGQRMAAGLRWTTWGLAVVGALLGWGAASAALAYDGSEPVNVLVFVGVFFVLQILLLAALVVALLARRGGGALSLPARIVGSIAQSRVVDRLLGAQDRFRRGHDQREQRSSQHRDGHRHPSGPWPLGAGLRESRGPRL